MGSRIPRTRQIGKGGRSFSETGQARSTGGAGPRCWCPTQSQHQWTVGRIFPTPRPESSKLSSLEVLTGGALSR